MCKKALILCSLILLVGCGNFSNPVKSTPPQESLLGNWSGVLDAGRAKITLLLHVQQSPDGLLTATLDSPEQRTNGILIDSLTFDGHSVKFEIKAAFAKFEGALSNEAEIVGRWTQGGQSFPLAFGKRIKSAEVPPRPQEPKLPIPYKEEQITYDNVEAGVTLSGTLTLPSSQGFFPAVLLVAGSGPNDRDETVLGHKPFLVLADHLTRQGIAVLRFDKRGCAQSSGNYEKATTRDFADDVLSGIHYLKSRQEVNPHQIGLIGHSEGGLIAPMVAADSKDVAFIVLMAGTGVTGEQVLYEQSAVIQRAEGATEESINQSRKLQEQLFTVVKKESNPEIAAEELRKVARNYIANLPEDQKMVSLEALEAQGARINTEWFRYFLTLDPSIALRQVQVPVLVLNGELDLQVLPQQNLPAISKALEESGNKDFTIAELPKLNHLFQTSETGSLAEYAKIEETMSPLALNFITEWILAKTTSK